MHLSDDTFEAPTPVWPAVGDLMACLFGIFVLFFVWTTAVQSSLAAELATEKATHENETQKLRELEAALAAPLAAGSITLVEGHIGIRGSVLFDFASVELRADGRPLLRQLAGPLKEYLAHSNELLMVSGFTDDVPLRGVHGNFKDNWELSSERALTVTRALVEAGIPREAVFAAGFGDSHPVAPNTTDDNRAKNRRVEIAPVPRSSAGNGQGAPR
ncbi:MAG: OmpA family protein [Polyangiaceae bacterium]